MIRDGNRFPFSAQHGLRPQPKISFSTKDRKMPQGIEDFLEDILVLGIILKGI
jgi:hypothetical protein